MESVMDSDDNIKERESLGLAEKQVVSYIIYNIIMNLVCCVW